MQQVILQETLILGWDNLIHLVLWFLIPGIEMQLSHRLGRDLPWSLSGCYLSSPQLRQSHNMDPWPAVVGYSPKNKTHSSCVYKSSQPYTQVRICSMYFMISVLIESWGLSHVVPGHHFVKVAKHWQQHMSDKQIIYGECVMARSNKERPSAVLSPWYLNKVVRISQSCRTEGTMHSSNSTIGPVRLDQQFSSVLSENNSTPSTGSGTKQKTEVPQD